MDHDEARLEDGEEMESDVVVVGAGRVLSNEGEATSVVAHCGVRTPLGKQHDNVIGWTTSVHKMTRPWANRTQAKVSRRRTHSKTYLKNRNWVLCHVAELDVGLKVMTAKIQEEVLKRLTKG